MHLKVFLCCFPSLFLFIMLESYQLFCLLITNLAAYANPCRNLGILAHYEQFKMSIISVWDLQFNVFDTGS